jgi:hypothetical protein
VGGTWKRNFTMFKKLCGEDAFNNVALVTTQWDQVTKEVADRRLDELKAKPQLFKPVMDGGAEIFKHDYRSEESGRKVIRHLINKAPKALLIQSEMAEGKEVLDTSAGQELQREIMELMERHRKEMTELLEDIEQTRDEAGIEELEEELRALRDKMAHTQAESQKLAGVPNGKTSPKASDFPLNSAFVATNVGSTSEQLGTKNTVPGKGGRLEKAGIPTSGRPDPPAGGEIPPTALGCPLNSALVVATNGRSTSEQPDEPHTKEKKSEREGDQGRLGETEKTLVGPRGGWLRPLRRLLNFFKRKLRRSPKS